jgi:uncharacterized membrane protein (DUF2068 family)
VPSPSRSTARLFMSDKKLRRKATRGAGPRRESGRTLLVLIGVFKVLKAALLIAVGIGALKFLHRDVAAAVVHWSHVLRIDPDNRLVHAGLMKIVGVTPRPLKQLSAGTFFYAGLFATEGIGLLSGRRWAEYFTIVSTGALIPLEIYELTHRFTAIRLTVLVVNVPIVGYLIRRVRERG